ncbi:MAG TPA: hypothetical protein VKZ95_03585 [Sphingobacteriaceae bacterium]|nr:hypothetical protein [Sphingobacteriaceae bacterium]
MLAPLKQFICDKCNNLIESPADGYVEWEQIILKGNPARLENLGFKIIHNSLSSPLENCFFYSHSTNGQSSSLIEFLNENQMPRLLSFLDAGPHHVPHYLGPEIQNMREFVEFARRLTLPYYEEARTFFHDAETDGYFEGANEIWIYQSEILKNLIDKYSS